MNLIDKYINSFERDIHKAFGLKKQGAWFSGETLMHQMATDPKEVKELILKHNHKVRQYNSLRGYVGRLAQSYINSEALELATKPVDSFIDAIAEFQRNNSIRKRPVFSGTDPYLAIQEERMNKLMDGKDGILDIRERIQKLRKI
jgi:hypothetical protein